MSELQNALTQAADALVQANTLVRQQENLICVLRAAGRNTDQLETLLASFKRMQEAVRSYKENLENSQHIDGGAGSNSVAKHVKVRYL